MPKMPIRKPPPAQHSDKIDTKQFGLALDFNTKEHPGYLRVKFDTGLILLVPNNGLFDKLTFHLQEVDPKPPEG